MKKTNSLIIVITILIISLFLIGCQNGAIDSGEIPPHGEDNNNSDDKDAEEDNSSDNEHEEEKDEPARDYLTEEELSLYRPNELGEAMILMYHSIGVTEAEWTRTPENFRRDLEELYKRGYRSVSLLDYVHGEIDLPPGTSPVIFTFDDSTLGQFNYIEVDEGLEIDPNSAVGILEDFYKDYPDFGRAATFYTFYPLPFRQTTYIQEKYEFLQDNGYEIGNHSYGHANFSKISQDNVIKELARHAKRTAEILPGYQVRTLALPYGAFPEDRSVLASGEYEGFSYTNDAILMVGYRPAQSPFSDKFDPMRLPRVRASETKVDGVGMYDWLKYFEANPHRRYISDGNPNTITIPEHLEENINPEAIGEKELRLYSLD